MLKHKNFTCAIIGQTSLTLQCAKILHYTGQTITAIITTYIPLKEWAGTKNIPCYTSFDLSNLINYDYLFSIANDRILPVGLLARASHFCINYHNSLLPRYAGIHATSWAILNDEVAHGVTWHLMTENIDDGAILKQKIIKIDSKETALGLNVICHELAKQLFSELVEELATDTYTWKQQDLTQRSYYGRFYKPPGNGLVNWFKPAKEISNLARALHFGHQPNQFSTAKIILLGKIYLIKSLQITNNKSTFPAGHLVTFNSNFFQISTIDYDVKIFELSLPSGKSYNLKSLSKRFLKKNSGDIITNPSEQLLKIFQEKSTFLAKYESFWVKKLTQIKNTSFPFLPSNLSSIHRLEFPLTKNLFITDILIPENLIKNLSNGYSAFNTEKILMTTLLIYFYRVLQQQKISISISYPELRKETKELDIFFASHVPFTIKLKNNGDFNDILKSVKREYKNIKKNKTFSNDVFSRYPEFKQKPMILPIGIIISNKNNPTKYSMNSHINFVISGQKRKITIYAHSSVINDEIKIIFSNFKENLLVMINAIAKDSKQIITKLPLISKSEKNTTIFEWNQTKKEFPEYKTIHRLFEEQVKKTPNKIAVVFEKQSLTYDELNSISNKLADSLLQAGVTPNALIAVCVERSLQMITTLLGILKSGAAYVPIETTLPFLRISSILEDSQPFAFITQSSIFSQHLNDEDWIKTYNVIFLDKPKKIAQINSKKNPKDCSNSNNLAYVIYTSGSTGKPKGVLVNHKSVVNCILASKQAFSVTSTDIYLTVTSLSFDMSALDCFLPLACGAKLVISNGESQKNVEQLIDTICLEKISIMLATPSTWEMFQIIKWQSPHKIKMLSIGEVLPSSLAQYLLNNGSLFNLYGPTEATLYATYTQIKEYQNTTIGRPISNIQIYILDKNLEPLPIGFSGEIHIGGAGLARGYLNNLQLTNEKFIKNPLLNSDKVIYKTGDLARWVPNGNIEYLNRIDTQVKLRGFRIELGEIEQLLLAYPDVKKSVVLIHKISEKHDQLLAFLSFKTKLISSTIEKIKEIQIFLSNTLPEYMIPKAFIILTDFPLNTAGKLDKNKLLGYIDRTIYTTSLYEQPTTSVEKHLVILWKNLLHIKQIGINDDFFSLGGDSISALTLINRAKKEYGISFTLQDIYKFTTIADLSKIIKKNNDLPKNFDESTKNNFLNVNKKSTFNYLEDANIFDDPLFDESTKHEFQYLLHSFPESHIEDIYPLTQTQQGLLYEQRLNPNSPVYQVQVRCTLRGHLSLKILQNAIQDLANRHKVLRSCFVWDRLKQPMQIIFRDLPLLCPIHDLRNLSYSEQNLRLKTITSDDWQQIINLQNASLLRVIIIILDDNHYEIIWHFNHAILDGWSFEILINELRLYYLSKHNNEPINLPATSSFSNYVQWLENQDWQEAKLFWQDYLKGFNSPNDLTALGVKSPIENISKINFSYLKLDQNLSDRLRFFSRDYGIRLNTLFQGVWGILLYRYTQLTDIVFGIITSGRNISLSDMNSRVGLFTNTFPLRIKFESDLTVLQYLNDLQQQIIQILAFDHASLSYIHSWSELSTTRLPLFDNMVAFENYPKHIETAQDICSFNQIDFYDPTHYALTLTVFPKNAFCMKIGYDTARISTVQAEHLLEQLQQLLQLTIYDSSYLITELPLLSFENYHQLIKQQNQPTNVQITKTIIEQFEEQAVNNPVQIALIDSQNTLSYRKLNEFANQLANFLKNSGVISGSRIAVFLPRGQQLIISLLAIWKAGGVYIPLDIKSPTLRLKAILELTEANFLITSSDVLSLVTNTISDEFIKTLLLDKLDLSIQSKSNLKIKPTLSDLAYILHTSGTTGLPKGIAHEHKTLTNLLQWQTRICSPAEHRNITQLANISFDVSLQELCYALKNGYTLHIVPEETKQSLTALVNFLAIHRINQTFLPTALLEPVCAAALFVNLDLDCLTDIFVAGEALKISNSIKEFFNKYLHIQLTNQYGPTETHVASFYCLNSSNIQHWPTLASIGQPIDNMQFYVLDKNFQPLPPEVPGELWIGGIGLARNYLGNFEQNTTQFTTITFSEPTDFDNSNFQSEQFSQHLYKTGDKVVRHNNGEFGYLGRLDEQVKIRGFRVELAEIELQLLQQPSIRQCVVVFDKDNNITPQLICYIVSKQTASTQLNITELRQLLAQTLPDYMLPTNVIYLEHLPLTSNGKIDTKNLPKPIKQSQIDNVPTLANTIYTQPLAKLWKAILNIKSINNQQNFFSLGGDSLSALRLLLEIEKHFGIKLAINDLLTTPTLLELSHKLQQHQANSLLTQHQTLEYLGQQLPFPIVPLQPTGNKIPLFLVHPIGGTVFWFIELARSLGTERPIYGIQDPSIIHPEMPPLFNTLEELATFYLHCIQKIQPHGPYLLAGSSFGATCVFEIAKQLTMLNETVNFVGLLDGWVLYPEELQEQQRFEKLMNEQSKDLQQRFQLNQLENANKWTNLQWQRSQMLWQYVLQPIDIPLELFKAEEPQPGLAWLIQDDNGWSNYSTKSLTIHKVPGNHETMFRLPNVKFLAHQINKIISGIKLSSCMK